MKKFIPQIEPWYGPKETALLQKYLRSGGWLTEFKETEKFEKIIADYLGVKHAVVVTNGTVALFLALKALGVGKGDEVIVPDYTMIATPNSVELAGAMPVFADIERDTMCLDIKNLPITKKTKVIIHVSINGRGGDIIGLRKICKANKIHLIEDACQSFTSRHEGKFLGTFGDIGCFSMSPHKIITTGQGGFLVMEDPALYEKIKGLKDFGRIRPGVDWHLSMGYNFKFTDMQSVFGIAQMSNIAKRAKIKKDIFRLYRRLLSGINGVEFMATDLEQTTPWCADIFVPADKRSSLIEHLKNHGIGSRVFYPAIHSQPIYKNSSKNKFPATSELVQRGLWLPSSMLLKESEIKYICSKIKNFFQK